MIRVFKKFKDLLDVSWDSSEGKFWRTKADGSGLEAVTLTIPNSPDDIGAQPVLVSGTNIKTINNTSLLGEGDITIVGGEGGTTDHGALSGLSDDDHTQYHNDTRGDLRYSQLEHTHDYAATTHNHTLASLSEKSYNSLTDKPSIPTQYTDEMAQDAISTLITNGTQNGITVAYDDINNKIDFTVTASGTSDVAGPASSTDGNIVLFDGVTGKVIKNSTYSPTSFAAALGDDDNYVTDAEKLKLANLSGTNTGDQDLSGYALTTHNHTGVYQPAGTYSTDIHNNINALNAVSGVNTGDQDLSGYSLTSHNHTGVYEPANVNIQSHISSTSNPHSVTAAQVGADATGTAAGLISTHSSSSDHDGRYYTETEADTKLAGKENYHGIEAIGAKSFDSNTHVLTLTSVTYWYKGTKFTTTSPVTCDLDSYVALTANTTYFVYFDDAAGTLKASASAWNLHEAVPAALLLWNGTVGVIGHEHHNHTRDIDWHKNAHHTIGTRYQSGLVQTAPSTAVDNQINIGAGTIWDEDIELTIGASTTARLWYKTATGYTFENDPVSVPYKLNGSQIQYLDTDTNTLTDIANNRYGVMWVYATSDTSVPIYLLVGEGATSFASVSEARAALPPNLANSPFNPESKLIYKWIFAGDGQYQEGADYRQSSTLPAGGATATSAASVTFTPSGNIAAATVQSAIEELDAEKQALLVSGTNIKTINGDSVLGSGNIVIEGGSGLTNPMTAAGDIIYGGANGTPTRLAKGTDGQVLTLASGLPAWAAASGGSLLVAETVVSGSAATTVSFTGLDGNAAGGYFGLVNLKNAYNGALFLSVFINGDTTAANYRTQYIQFNNTTGGSSLVNNAQIGYSGVLNQCNALRLNIDMLPDNTVSMTNLQDHGVTTGFFALFAATRYFGTGSSNITSITFTASQANGIGIGSNFRLYRRK